MLKNIISENLKESKDNIRYPDGLRQSLNRATDGNLWGYVNRKKEIVIPLQYFSANQFVDRVAGVKTEKGYTLINNKGERLINEYFEFISVFSNKMAQIYDTNTKIGLISNKGKLIQPIIYDHKHQRNGYIVLYKYLDTPTEDSMYEKVVVVNKDHEDIITLDKAVTVKYKNDYVLFDTKNDVIYQFEYDNIVKHTIKGGKEVVNMNTGEKKEYVVNDKK